MPRLLFVVTGLFVLLGTSVPTLADERVDFYNRKGQRDGYAVIDRKQGRIDTYDKNSNRTGYGTIDRNNGSVEIFSTGGGRKDAPKGGHSGGGQRR